MLAEPAVIHVSAPIDDAFEQALADFAGRRDSAALREQIAGAVRMSLRALGIRTDVEIVFEGRRGGLVASVRHGGMLICRGAAALAQR